MTGHCFCSSLDDVGEGEERELQRTVDARDRRGGRERERETTTTTAATAATGGAE
jgi:hypothetical protein